MPLTKNTFVSFSLSAYAKGKFLLNKIFLSQWNSIMDILRLENL